jgi:D-amino-acid dehydrogenase
MSKRVVIVGAGIIGLSTAYYCARRGFQVTVVERKAAQRDGTSYGNAGMVVPSHFIPLAAPGMVALGLKWMWNPASPFYIKPRLNAALFDWGCKFWRAATAAHVQRSAPVIRDLSLASRTCFEEFAALPGVEFGLVKKGLLMLCQTEHALQEEGKTAAQARALGVPAEVLDAKQTAALDPGATMNIAGAIHFPLDCHLSPAQFMAALQAQLVQLGVTFIWDSEALGFKLDGDRRLRALEVGTSRCDVRTAQRAVPTTEIEGDEFVLCGGSWSPQLAEQLELNIPMQAGKGYSLTLPQPRQLPQLCSILCEARVAVTPMGRTLRVGGTMEIAGLNEDINPVRVRGIIDSFCRYYPEFQPADFDGVQPWRGLRPCSPDGMPYVGRTQKFSNLSLSTGHAMMGLSLGPVSGKLMAEVLANEKPSHDLTLLSPDRYN